MIACSGFLFLVELFADKIHVFDLLWNALHTFVRVPVTALVAYGATVQLTSGWQLFAMLLRGTIALAAHGGMTAVRAAVTPHPEPFSNVMPSLGEDTLAVFLTRFATRHPQRLSGPVPRRYRPPNTGSCVPFVACWTPPERNLP